MNLVFRKIILLGFVIVVLSSCSSPLSSRISEYVREVEQNSENWSEEEWQVSKEEYSKLIEEYELNKSTLSKIEIDSINQSIGRYKGLLLKQSLKDAGNAVKDFAERLPSLVEGFVSTFGDNAETDEQNLETK